MNHLKFFFVLSLVFFGSCVSFDSREISSWALNGKEVKGTIRIISVNVEKQGDMVSLENETKELFPLLFYEEGYIAVSPPVSADYTAEVTLREREYLDGWQTIRSISVEVRIWADEISTDTGVPLAAGRVLNHGKKTLSSSTTLSAMLRAAVRSAVRELGD